MISFPDFFAASAKKDHTHVLFEWGMYSLVEDLERILDVFKKAHVPFELISGLAVLVHVIAAGKGNRSFLTKDIDVLMERADLETLTTIAEASGYQVKRMIGGYALLLPGQDLAQATHDIAPAN